MAERNSGSDGEWDNLDELAGSAPAVEAPTVGWDDDDEEPWPAPEVGEPLTRGPGRPRADALRRRLVGGAAEDMQGGAPMTADELVLLQAMQEQVHGDLLPSDWEVDDIPRGDIVTPGSEVEAWQNFMAPGLQVGHKKMLDRSANKRSDTTPSSFNTDKQYELMKDISKRFLPAFANDENRSLNVMIQEGERALKEMEDATQKQGDRTTVMEDHMLRVQEEITVTQERVEAKKKEILTEEHLKKLAIFQTKQLKREVLKMEREMHEMIEQLRSYQENIVAGNEKLEKICEMQHWSKQELEQWVAAALKKEEDLVALESYRKCDDIQLIGLRLEEQTCSKELAKYRDLLEAEMSETHGCQAALDKAAVEFRTLHAERQDVIRQWEETIDQVHERDEQIFKLTQEFAQNQHNLREQKYILGDFGVKLHNAQETYAEYEVAIRTKNLNAQKLKATYTQEMEKLKKSWEVFVNLKTEHFQAQHKYANEMAKKLYFQEEIARQKHNFQEAREKIEKMKKKVEEEYNYLDTLEKQTTSLEKMLHTEELNLISAKKEVADLHEKHHKWANKLFHLRTYEEAALHEIKGGKCVAKGLVHKITILEKELQKKEQKVYNAAFQIQALEGKISRASGEINASTDFESQKLVKELEGELAQVKSDNKSIDNQMRRSLADMQKSSTKKHELESRNKKLSDKNAELNMDCDTGMIVNKNMTKEREEVALEADILQMEVQRLTDLLHLKADEVFNLDRLKQQLIRNMEDRKAEVDAQQEVQKKEMRLIGEELHGLKMKRQKLIIKINKLQCKHDCLLARIKSSDGKVMNAEAYLEQMNIEKENTQKKGVAMSEELKKARVDVKFLETAKKQIIDSNNNLRTSLTENERTLELEEEAKELKEELQKVRDRARTKQIQEKSYLQEIAEAEAKIKSREEACANAEKESENSEIRIEHAQKDQEEQSAKQKRAIARLNSIMREFQAKVSTEEAKRVAEEIVLSEIRASTKDVLRKLNQLGMEHPEFAQVITAQVQAHGFKLPTGPGSTRSSSSDSVASTPRRGAKGSRSPPRAVRGGASASTSVLNMEFNGSSP